MKKKLRVLILSAMTAVLLGTGFTSQAAPSYWEFTSDWTEGGNIYLDFPEFTVTIPGSWNGRFQVGTSDESISFSQRKSREQWTNELGYPNGGLLFTICRTTEYDFYDFPEYKIIGDGDGYCYYIMYPTDYQAYPDGGSIETEFLEMSSQVEWIVDTITLKDTAAESPSENTASTEDDDLKNTVSALSGDIPADGYIVASSSTARLSANDLQGLTSSELQMAINEIYAKHHRKFTLSYVQDYFNSRTWYRGTIEAKDFDAASISSLEWENIATMQKCIANK